MLDKRAQAMEQQQAVGEFSKAVQAVALVEAVVLALQVEQLFNHNNQATLELMDLVIQAVLILILHHIMVMAEVVLVVLVL